MTTLTKAQSIVGTSEGRPEHDFYPTPAYVTQALLDRECFNNDVWEPACGDGSMSKVLEENGYNVRSTDLIYRGYGEKESVDFLYQKEHVGCTSIITNPPFTLAQEFVEHAASLTYGKYAIFGKLSFLEGKARKKMFQYLPLKKVLVFSQRVKLTREGKPYKNGGMIAFAWYIFDPLYIEEPTIGWI